ncbi:MAG: GTPase HflX [Rhodospirillaceae bacterium]|nr:GTPase HflX [Rhodospirillaceae bacterium]
MTWNSSDSTRPSAARAVVVHPEIRGAPQTGRSSLARLEEAVRLAEAIKLDISHSETVSISRIRPSALFGKGSVERIGAKIAALNAEIAIIDWALSPVQQRNLERAWHCKVLDRTGLILEIFGARARTKEGVLQVELAALNYQRSRLVRSWTHLERQRGGVGFMGGPGETQIEADRRLIGDRITKLKRELKDVRRTRAIHRATRQKVPYPIIALVGYTNAGKSTLFNMLTDANVISKDQLFATLDPKMRGLKLPSGQEVVLSDTVGFISDLPHELVEAFQATLEEVMEADVLLHVRDIADPASEEQKSDVINVLANLGLSVDGDRTVIEVRNKSDLLDQARREFHINSANRSNNRVVLLSAASGEGVDQLLFSLGQILCADWKTLEINIPWSDGKTLAWIYAHGEVISRNDRKESVNLTVRLHPRDANRLNGGVLK